MFLRILKVKEEVFPSSYNYFDQNNTPRFQYGDLQMTRDQRAPFSAPGAALNYFLKRPHTLLTFDAVLNVDLGSTTTTTITTLFAIFRVSKAH